MFPLSEAVTPEQSQGNINIAQKAALMYTSVHQELNTFGKEFY